MTDTKLEISKECESRGHPDWVTPLLTIVQNYTGYPMVDPNHDPAENIVKALKNYSYLGDHHDTGGIAYSIAKLNIFCYQAYVRHRDAKVIIPWNPLEQNYESFAKAYPEHERIEIVEGPYPPENHIRMWFYLHAEKPDGSD
ncbi:MAG: hypothetical protein DSZ28_06760 [Thiothrix sp.]|nr:MAG: hypothetical protein DSZ28_06760 [Thiothrix sp.]